MHRSSMGMPLNSRINLMSVVEDLIHSWNDWIAWALLLRSSQQGTSPATELNMSGPLLPTTKLHPMVLCMTTWRKGIWRNPGQSFGTQVASLSRGSAVPAWKPPPMRTSSKPGMPTTHQNTQSGFQDATTIGELHGCHTGPVLCSIFPPHVHHVCDCLSSGLPSGITRCGCIDDSPLER